MEIDDFPDVMHIGYVLRHILPLFFICWLNELKWLLFKGLQSDIVFSTKRYCNWLSCRKDNQIAFPFPQSSNYECIYEAWKQIKAVP